MSTPANSTSNTNNTQAYEIREKLARLESSLKESTPGIATLLRDIHGQLKKDPDIVTLLSDEECNTLVQGLKKQTSTEIAVSALKGTRKKAISKMTVSDL
jgi:hypothetical protein